MMFVDGIEYFICCKCLFWISFYFIVNWGYFFLELVFNCGIVFLECLKFCVDDFVGGCIVFRGDEIIDEGGVFGW